MRIVISEDKVQAGKQAAIVFAAQLLAKPESVLGLATGSTPLPLYQELSAMNQARLIDFSRAVTFNLDEYVGLPKTHEQSYVAFMQENLFRHINIRPEAVHLPCGMADDLDAECERYEAAISAAGGIDVQLLGIGHNGHIGFNEPCDVFPQKTNVVSLTAETIDANKRFFDSADQVPRRALSMGIGTIMQARQIVMIATGEDKADAVYGMVREPVNPRLPASILQYHANVLVFLDRGAAKRI